MKKVLVLLLALGFVYSCEKDPIVEPVVETCESVDSYYSDLILEIAEERGYDSSVFYQLNTTNPFEPGYFDFYYDPNFAIFRGVMAEYLPLWTAARAELGCN